MPSTRRSATCSRVLPCWAAVSPPRQSPASPGLPSATVDSILAELLRREVLLISADPRSPERGNYRFSQELLRQVAYETLSRRDRKSRHLAVAAHLRATFPRDGEEVVDVVARHYVDALEAVPDDGDVAEIPRVGDCRARRGPASVPPAPGASSRAASNFLGAAELVERADASDPRGPELLLRAAQATVYEPTSDAAVRIAERALSRPTSLWVMIVPWHGRAPCSGDCCADLAGTRTPGCS